VIKGNAVIIEFSKRIRRGVKALTYILLRTPIK
jgi:hypothetical protein